MHNTHNCSKAHDLHDDLHPIFLHLIPFQQLLGSDRQDDLDGSPVEQLLDCLDSMQINIGLARSTALRV